MLTLVVLVLSGAALISPVPARRHATDLYVCRSLEHAGTVQEEMESENSVVAQLSADVTQLKARYTADVASLERQLSAMQSMLGKGVEDVGTANKQNTQSNKQMNKQGGGSMFVSAWFLSLSVSQSLACLCVLSSLRLDFLSLSLTPCPALPLSLYFSDCLVVFPNALLKLLSIRIRTINDNLCVCVSVFGSQILSVSICPSSISVCVCLRPPPPPPPPPLSPSPSL